MVWLVAQYVLKAVIRDRLPLIFFVSMLICLSLCTFFGSAAMTEQDQFAIIFMANVIRLLSVSFVILYISFYFARAFDTRDIEALLTRPISRLQYLIGHYLAFQGLIFSFILFLFIIFLFFIRAPDGQEFLWLAGLLIELSLVGLVALFFGLLLSHGIASIFLSFGLYLLGRFSGSLLDIVATPSDPNIFSAFGGAVMQLISIIIPRFDLMLQSGWLIYPASLSTVQITIIIAQFFVFTGLVLSAAYYDLIRKQF